MACAAPHFQRIKTWKTDRGTNMQTDGDGHELRYERYYGHCKKKKTIGLFLMSQFALLYKAEHRFSRLLHLLSSGGFSYLFSKFSVFFLFDVFFAFHRIGFYQRIKTIVTFIVTNERMNKRRDKRTDGQLDGRADGHTFFRDARTNLKMHYHSN